MSEPNVPDPMLPTGVTPSSEPPTTRTPPPPVTATPAVRPRNGLGVAALVIGVASLVAAISFTLFPLALITGLVGTIIGIIGLTRTSAGRATNSGQAVAGTVCSGLALIIAIVFAVGVGTWVERNTDVFARFDKCIAQAGNRTDVSTCIARLAQDVRP
jgi:hypothetical protein